MSDAVLKELLAEVRMMREEMSEMREDFDMAHQKIDGLSVLLSLLAGATVETERDRLDEMMDEIGEDNPQ
ncbi:hypothetical protein ATO8_16143 [Roseivivax marinus]|uniref:Uncharacterized protein n=1 Tax=Roseivivax marinus TaxID=1379903 RepID=W4HGG8_9RHOB|nr:hypothetical protein [Roseivivax marinus]ETW11794.1 hypothetical protein ATO8_16143 [Roseivivax marinus]UMA65676.1 hypothetical protein LVO79_04220 [Roseivivax marinus]SEL48673.1 hypothetical protein SAMN05444413_109190 [Roseivivax marinus]